MADKVRDRVTTAPHRSLSTGSSISGSGAAAAPSSVFPGRSPLLPRFCRVGVTLRVFGWVHLGSTPVVRWLTRSFWAGSEECGGVMVASERESQRAQFTDIRCSVLPSPGHAPHIDGQRLGRCRLALYSWRGVRPTKHAKHAVYAYS